MLHQVLNSGIFKGSEMLKQLANEKQLDQYGEKSVKNQTQPDTSLSVR